MTWTGIASDLGMDRFGLGTYAWTVTGPEADVALGGRSAADAGPKDVLEGVVDLAFLEDGGWVIVDYKTDVGTDPDFPVRVEAYRRQVDLYAKAWSHLTGDPVRERVLFFTSQSRVESW